MFIEVPQFQENSPALKKVWLRAWIRYEKYLKICTFYDMRDLVLQTFEI